MVMKSLLAGIAVMFGSVCFVAAQQPVAPDQQPVNPANPNGRQVGRMGADLDHHITDCVIDGNKAEIALARIAEQRASDPQVKQFAQKMLHDHTSFMNKLESESGRPSRGVNNQPPLGQPVVNQQPGVQQPGNGDQFTPRPSVDIQAPGTQVRIGRRNGMRGGRDGAAREFLQVEKEVHQQCLQSKTRELSQKEGAQFDRCYMHGQVAAHMQMADELTVFSRHASTSLQPILQDGLQTTQQHLALARQIAERLDGGTQRSASSNPNPRQQ